jgi:hypothetical protein
MRDLKVGECLESLDTKRVVEITKLYKDGYQARVIFEGGTKTYCQSDTVYIGLRWGSTWQKLEDVVWE